MLLPILRMHTRRAFLAAAFVLCAIAAAAGAATPAAPAPDPWALVQTLRAALADDAPLQAGFEQTFVPAGFSSGETERGTFSLALPDCLRWDYQEPYPKSFLICGTDAYSWNRDELSGHYMQIAAKDEPGLDLLLLPTAELQRRYQGAVKKGQTGAPEIWLTPIERAGNTPVSATLELDSGGKRLIGLSYADHEGNRTRFVLSNYRPLRAGDNSVFSPPAQVRWQED
jgi:outer membrane lipoprotein-sorting protein